MAESEFLPWRRYVFQRVAHSVGEKILNHIGGHRLGGSSCSDIAAAGAHSVFCFVIGFFAARRKKNLYNIGSVNVFRKHIEQAHRRRQNVLANAVFNLQHIAVDILHAHNRSVFVNANIDNAAFAIVEKGDNFLLNIEFVGQLSFQFYAVAFGHFLV